MNRTPTRSLLTAAAVATTIATASAAPLAYEGFDYAVGAINGANGGSGFASAWTQATESAGGAASVLATPGLLFAGVDTIGNTFVDNAGSARGAVRVLPTAGLFTDGSSLWFSALFSVPASTTGSDFRVKFFALDTASVGASAYIDTGFGFRIGGNGIIEAENSGVFTSSATAFTKDTTHLVVGRVDFSDAANGDALRIWLDPTTLSAPADGSASATFTGINLSIAAQNTRLAIRGGGSFVGSVDEIRLASDFGSVIPEPSTWALLGGIGSLLAAAILRRSRR